MRLRPAATSDASALRTLLGVLGYEVATDELAERITALPDDHAILVAEIDAEVVGFVHVLLDHSLAVGRRAQLGGLAVAEDRAGHGVGQRLLDAAETWARAAGCPQVWIRSGTERIDAHAFYRRQGYEDVKDQRVFRKAF